MPNNKPTEVDSMNRLRVQAEREVSRLKDVLRMSHAALKECQRTMNHGNAWRVAADAVMQIESALGVKEDGNAR